MRRLVTFGIWMNIINCVTEVVLFIAGVEPRPYPRWKHAADNFAVVGLLLVYRDWAWSSDEDKQK